MTTKLRARLYRPTAANMIFLARVLARGGLVAAPTETVYGLAADALNVKACKAIFKAKDRPITDPLIVHVDTLARARRIAVLSPEALKIAKAFWPGPLTMVLPKQPGVPAIVTSGLTSVAVRMPDHPLFRRLIRLSGCPLAAPSANPFGYVSPTTAEHVKAGLGKRIRHILDGGSSEIGVESTILDLRDPFHPAILRPGAISRKALQAVLGRRVGGSPQKILPNKNALPAPGMLKSHYSPRTPVNLLNKVTRTQINEIPADEAVLLQVKPAYLTQNNVFWLTANGELPKAAHILFSILRQLDNENWRKINAEVAPGRSALALAINDRLTRAAANK